MNPLVPLLTTDLISNPDFYLVAVPAVLLNSISKGGFGGAFGDIAVPLMALAISPLVPAGVTLGFWLQRRVNHVWFYRIARACLFLSGL